MDLAMGSGGVEEDARANHMGSGPDDDGLGGGGTMGEDDEAMAGREGRARGGPRTDLGGKTNERIGEATDLSTIGGGNGALTDLSNSAGSDDDEMGDGGAAADAKSDGADDEGLKEGGAADATKKKRKRKKKPTNGGSGKGGLAGGSGGDEMEGNSVGWGEG
jgi:hypothetical protein